MSLHFRGELTRGFEWSRGLEYKVKEILVVKQSLSSVPLKRRVFYQTEKHDGVGDFAIEYVHV